MKKAIYAALLFALMGIATTSQAQNCYKIVEPYLDRSGILPADYPAEKFDWRCHFSYSCFYLTDELPTNATVFSIDQLKDVNTGENLPAHYVVNLETFSYWAYPFTEFQAQDKGHTIYFDTHNSTNRYLAVRTPNEAEQFRKAYFKED